MRVLVVRPGPWFSVADVCRGWVRGLTEAGAHVLDLNFDDMLDAYATVEREDEETGERRSAWSPQAAAQLASRQIEVACFRHDFDFVLVVSGFSVCPETLLAIRRRGIPIVALFTESPYEDDRQLDFAQYCDRVLLNDPTNLEQFQSVVAAEYVHHCYDPAIHQPGPPVDEWRCDFGWVGTMYPSRREWFEQVDWSDLDVKFGGMMRGVEPDSPLWPHLVRSPNECMANDETVELYRSCKVSANLYRKEAERPALSDGWAMGPREVELAACGTFFLREPRGESDEVLGFLPTIGEPEQFGDLVRWYAAHDSVREGLAARARAAVAERTFVNHAYRLLSRFA